MLTPTLIIFAALQLLTEATIRCESKWPTDFQMQEYCIEQQLEGASSIRDFMDRYQVDENFEGQSVSQLPTANLILYQCFNKWSEDYSMFAYCVRTQEEAAQRLGKLPRVSSSNSKNVSGVDDNEGGLNTQVASPPDSKIVLDAEVLLYDLGFLAERADGLLRGNTVAAIIDYQTAYDLPASGDISDELVAHLRQKKLDLVQVQSALKQLGYYRGEADGIFGGETKAAVIDYESAQGLPITGQIGKELVRRLGSSAQ